MSAPPHTHTRGCTHTPLTGAQQQQQQQHVDSVALSHSLSLSRTEARPPSVSGLGVCRTEHWDDQRKLRERAVRMNKGRTTEICVWSGIKPQYTFRFLVRTSSDSGFNEESSFWYTEPRSVCVLEDKPFKIQVPLFKREISGFKGSFLNAADKGKEQVLSLLYLFGGWSGRADGEQSVYVWVCV